MHKRNEFCFKKIEKIRIFLKKWIFRKFAFFFSEIYRQKIRFFSQKFIGRKYAYFIQKFITENHYATYKKKHSASIFMQRIMQAYEVKCEVFHKSIQK